MSPMQLEDQDVVEFLTGLNTLRDGASLDCQFCPASLSGIP